MNLKINQSILVLFVLTIVGCSGESSDAEKPEEIIVERFENFPNSFFLDLEFSNFEENEVKLINQNFTFNNDLYISNNDSIIASLNKDDKSFILHLAGSDYLDNSLNVFQYFSSKSDSLIGDENLAELWYFQNNYKMFYFGNKSEIRIEFTEL